MKKRFILAAVAAAALVLAPAPVSAQFGGGVSALTAASDGAYSFGGWAKFSSVAASLDLGHIKHEVDDPTHQRDRLQVAGLGVGVGPVTVMGHYGQAVCAHTLNVYGGSLWYDKFGARVLRFEGETRVQAGIRLPIGGGTG